MSPGMFNYPHAPEAHQTLLLTLDEVAHELRVSRRYVEQMIARGDLTAVRFGGCVRLRRADLEDFVASHTTHSPPGPETDVA